MNELPKGWYRAPLEQIAGIKLGKMLDKAKNKGDLYPYLRNVNVRWGDIELSDLLEMPFLPDELDTYCIQDGDLFICEGGEPGRSAVWRRGQTSVKFQKAIHRVRFEEGMTPEFFAAELRYAAAVGSLDELFVGTTIKHLTRQVLAARAFPVPPSEEQRRIVAKLDALDASAKRARADLDRIPTLVARAKQAILAREFDRIVEGCDLVSFGDMLEHLTSGSRDWSSYYDRGSCVFVLAGNIRPLYFDPEPKKMIDPPLDSRDAQRSRIQKNDLLLTIVGAGTGDICVFSGDYENYYVCQSVALIRLKDPRLALFFSYWFNGEKHGQGDFTRAMYGAARPHLSFDQIREFPVPLISWPQAAACVGRIEAAFAKIDRIAAEAASARALLDRLDQAILAKAFRGDLVPQDPSDEPAEKLLEKIKAARAAPPARKARKKQS